jgi:hypothetical protein
MADAVVIPGRLYGPSTGMLLYAGDVAESRGATVHRHDWASEPTAPFDPTVEAWVQGEIVPRLDGLGGDPLLIGKSLGTNAAGLAADRSLPAVWLTPLLTSHWVVAALSRATAPFLLVGGTADSVWDEGVAKGLTPHVLSVEGADHGMYVAGPLIDSVAVLGRMVERIDTFLDTIGWPGSA